MDADDARQRLGDERDRLLSLQTGFEADGIHRESEQESLGELSASDQHQAEVGTETFDRERDLSILEQVEAELADIEHALHRIDEGTYGTCEACGARIDDARLEALPAARFCLADQSVAEREARVAGEQL